MAIETKWMASITEWMAHLFYYFILFILFIVIVTHTQSVLSILSSSLLESCVCVNLLTFFFICFNSPIVTWTTPAKARGSVRLKGFGTLDQPTFKQLKEATGNA